LLLKSFEESQIILQKASQLFSDHNETWDKQAAQVIEEFPKAVVGKVSGRRDKTI
jgi:hypothetical protein